ncbi:hypothetical protein BGY98DRAFT_605725 [Russula aff. rugulosa BPL654]|nr:hypothetical protein BGY98DRAFT_605725 [Russula aff. rugulosa BPL654]
MCTLCLLLKLPCSVSLAFHPRVCLWVDGLCSVCISGPPRQLPPRTGFRSLPFPRSFRSYSSRYNYSHHQSFHKSPPRRLGECYSDHSAAYCQSDGEAGQRHIFELLLHGLYYISQMCIYHIRLFEALILCIIHQ